MRLAGHDPVGASSPAAAHEVVGPRRRAVEDRDAVALLGNVERQIGAHDAKADQADFRFCHRLRSSILVTGQIGFQSVSPTRRLAGSRRDEALSRLRPALQWSQAGCRAMRGA